ncbi:nucleoid disruption protein [Aeromonas phage ZPAH1]|nr:nucleoid disruption protein [Aeromonas phage Aswh_1]QQG34110.1 nucleoid disruption protein [Aeromonas phage ZPAH1]
MKKNLTTKELVKHGAVVVGNFNGLNLDEIGDITTQGFYFISAPNSSVVYATHVGNQQRQRGFGETMIRIRRPRTKQAQEVNSYLQSGKSVKLYFMKYSQIRNLLKMEEYGQMNNGHELISKVRGKFIIHGRLAS